MVRPARHQGHHQGRRHRRRAARDVVRLPPRMGAGRAAAEPSRDRHVARRRAAHQPEEDTEWRARQDLTRRRRGGLARRRPRRPERPGHHAAGRGALQRARPGGRDRARWLR